VVIGRGESADIRVDDPAVSRRHVRLTFGSRMTVEDLGSANGTRVHGDIIPGRTERPLAAGIGVELGQTIVVVQQGNEDAPHDVRRPEDSLWSDERSTRRADAHVVSDRVMMRRYKLLERVSQGNISVLLAGETGVGKEVMAHAVHRSSPRAKKPFVKLNCAAIPESLFESELFGHVPGAFTGAEGTKRGLLESADGGTVFLDEIGEMPMSMQAKLLRVIEQKELIPVGGVTPRAIDVRFVAATNRDLEAECAEGRFRRDLYYRLNGITVEVPPLRERDGEIEGLANAFVLEYARQLGFGDAPVLSTSALDALKRHRWPGNIRELRNVIERAVLLSAGGSIRLEHLPFTDDEPAVEGEDDLWRSERRRIMDALAKCSGNQTRAAKTLGISRRTLVSRMVTHRIPRPHKPLPGIEDRLPISEYDSTDPSNPRAGERNRIVSALEACSGNQTRAAKMLSMSRRTLVSRMVTHRIPRPRKPLPQAQS